MEEFVSREEAKFKVVIFLDYHSIKMISKGCRK